MSVTGSTTRNDYVATFGQNVFNYTFQALLSSDLKVIKSGAVLSLNTDYTVAIVSNSGGFVTLSAPASDGDTISILLAMPIDRTTQYQNAGDFLASDVNGDMDKGYIAMNQLQTDISRAIRLKDQDPTVDMTLPVKANRANKFLKFDSLGRPFVASGPTAIAVGSGSYCNTVADMVNNSGLEVGDVATTLGYYSTYDGGGNTYKIVDVDTGTADGGSYIDLVGIDGQAKATWEGGAIIDLQYGIKRDAVFQRSGEGQTDGTDNGPALVALLATAKANNYKVLFTDGIATTNTPLVMDKALVSIHGTGKLMSFLNIGATFPVGSSLLTITDCGRTEGTGTNEKPYFTDQEKSVELVGFTLLGRQRTVRANGLSFTGLNDDMIIDVECRDFLGIGMSLGNANVTKINAGLWVTGQQYKIAFLGTATGDDEDEKEAAIQARWNAYLSTTDVTYRIGKTFEAQDNGASMTGAVAAVGYTSDTVRESTFENIQIKNCGNRNLIGGVQYDNAAMEIGSNGSSQGDNNIWMPLLRIIYPRGKALKVVPNVSNRARKIRIGHLFLHANNQLPAVPVTTDPLNPNKGYDPNGEKWRAKSNLVVIGTQGAVEGSAEIASISVDQVDLVGLEVPYKCFEVNTGSSLHINGFTGNAPDKSKYFYFNGAETSSIRDYNRGGIRVGSPVKSTANLIEIDATNGMFEGHQLSVSGLQAPTVPSGQKKFATLEAGNWSVGNSFVVRELGTGGNAAWVTYTGIDKTWAYGDTFVGTANSQAALTGAIAGTGGFVEGQEYKIFDLGYSFTDSTCDYNDGTTVTHDANSSIVAGLSVTGAGIPVGATIASITDSTNFVLSAATTGGAVTNGTLKFYNSTEIQNKWNNYFETTGESYSVGDVFTGTANDSTLLTGGVARKIYYPSYVGDIKHVNDDNVVVANIYKPQDANAGTPFARTSLYVARGTTYIQKLYLVTNSELVADDTNYAQIQFIKVRADQTTCPLNSQTPPAEDCFAGQIARIETKTIESGGTGSWKIGQIIEIPFTEPRLDAGEGLAFTINKPSEGGGTGVVVPHLGVVAELSSNLSLQTAD